MGGEDRACSETSAVRIDEPSGSTGDWRRRVPPLGNPVAANPTRQSCASARVDAVCPGIDLSRWRAGHPGNGRDCRERRTGVTYVRGGMVGGGPALATDQLISAA